MSEEGEIKIDLVKIALAIQLTIFGLIGLDIIGINFPILRGVIILAYLTYLILPGMLILRILNVETSPLKTFLLSLGISLSAVTLMLTLANVVISFFVEKPLSKAPLTVSLSFLVLLLILLLFLRKRSPYFRLHYYLPNSPLYALIFLLPILTLCGKVAENNILIFIVLSVISFIPIIILLKGNERIYPLILWITALSISFLHFTFEHRFNMRLADQSPNITEAVKLAGVWDPQYPSTHNSLLFPSILPAAFSILTNVNLALTMCILGSITISVIPVILYEVYRNFLSPKYAFLASCLYIFYPFFIQGPVFISRTSSAFFFTSLLLLLLTSDEIKLSGKSLLFIIFAFSLIASHYGTAYMFMFLLILISVLYFYEKKFRDSEGEFISYTFIVLFITMALSWYMYTSGAQNFNWGVNFGNHIISNLKEFFSPEESAAMRAFVTRSVTPSFSLEATKWLLFILLIFIIIGAVKLLYLYLKNRIDARYAILTLAFCCVLLGLTQMGMPRIFGFSLLLTAPLAMWGLSEILKLMSVKDERKHLLVFAAFLFVLFAFNYGIVANTINAVTGEARDMSLCGTFKEKILESDNVHFKRLIYWGWEPDSTIKATAWFFIHQDPERRIYVDSLVADSHLFTLHLPREYGGKIVCNLTQPRTSGIEKVLKSGVRDGYVFLAYHNIHDNFIFVVDKKRNEIYYKTSDYQDIFGKMNMIYNSGGGVICHAW